MPRHNSLTDYKKVHTITYEKFFKSIHACAHSLKELAVEKDEFVPLLMPNIPESRFLIYANNMLGAISYPMSPMMPVELLKKTLKKYKINKIFIDENLYEKYEKALIETNLETIVMIGTCAKKVNRKIIPWKEFVSIGQKCQKITPYYRENHTAVVVGTSGTTGTPKGVCLTDRNLNSAALSYLVGKVFEGNTVLDALLPSIVYGLVMSHFEIIASKYVYMMPELLLNDTSKVLVKLAPDVFFGGPVHYINMANSEEFKEGKIPKRNIYMSGGASLPKNIECKLNQQNEGYIEGKNINKDIIVRQGYALSESGGLGTVAKPGKYMFGSVGVPMMFNHLKIFEPGTDRELKRGEIGEICISGPSVMKGYLDNQTETESVIKIHRDGSKWLHTQDLGYLTEDMKLFHVDRIKNIFMRKGFNVHPQKIAEFLNGFPFVRNSTVVGFEHPIDQTVPVAFIELDDTVNSDIEKVIEVLKEECVRNLEETSIPAEYFFVDVLPINSGGKVNEKLLKKASGLDYNTCKKPLNRMLKLAELF